MNNLEEKMRQEIEAYDEMLDEHNIRGIRYEVMRPVIEMVEAELCEKYNITQTELNTYLSHYRLSRGYKEK